MKRVSRVSRLWAQGRGIAHNCQKGEKHPLRENIPRLSTFVTHPDRCTSLSHTRVCTAWYHTRICTAWYHTRVWQEGIYTRGYGRGAYTPVGRSGMPVIHPWVGQGCLLYTRGYGRGYPRYTRGYGRDTLCTPVGRRVPRHHGG